MFIEHDILWAADIKTQMRILLQKGAEEENTSESKTRAVFMSLLYL